MEISRRSYRGLEFICLLVGIGIVSVGYLTDTTASPVYTDLVPFILWGIGEISGTLNTLLSVGFFIFLFLASGVVTIAMLGFGLKQKEG